LAKVDCTVETGLQSRFGVKGYPTLKVFRKGTPTDYNGPREQKGIISYMEKQAGPSAKPITSSEQLKKLTNANDVVVLGFFPSKSGAAYTNFLKVADSLRDNFKFAEVNDQSILDEYKVKEGIVILKHFDEKENVYGGSNTVSALTDYIWEKSLPIAGEFSQDTADRYKKRGLPILKVYINNVDTKGSNSKRTNYYLNRLKKVAAEKDLEGKLTFALVDKNKYASEVTQFGLDASKEVQVAIDNFPGSTKFRSNHAEFNIDNVKSFAKDFVANKLKPYLKSEPIPAEQADVKVVVGENFNDIVMDDSKNVLFEMYAPWCGHCKKLEPIYNELAAKLKNVPNVVIAKMDATANDSPHAKYQAKGYPTIFFSPAGKKDDPQPYSGERTVEAFTSFLKSKIPNWSEKDEL